MPRNLSLYILVTLCTALFSGLASAEEFVEGKQYQVINPAQPTSTGDKVEVVELFWYGCPHCFSFEPYINRWLKNKSSQAEFVRIPAVLRPEWAFFARAYYTAEALGVLDKIHGPLFERIHELKQPPKDEAELKAFFKEYGVKEEDFAGTFRSFAVDSKVRRAQDLSHRYGANGVPTMIVNGKYRTSGSEAGSADNVIKVINYLIQKEAKK